MATVFDDIVTQAKASVERPSYYFPSQFEDDHPEFGRSGVSVTRDSNIIEKSNWESILAYVKETYPESDYHVIHASHWAVGHCSELLVRVLNNYDPYVDDEEFFDEDNITAIFKDMMDIVHVLTCDYPIFNETVFSRMEYEEILDNIKWQSPNWSADVNADEVYDWLREHDFEPESESFTDREVELACYKLGFVDPNYQEEVSEWVSQNADMIARIG